MLGEGISVTTASEPKQHQPIIAMSAAKRSPKKMGIPIREIMTRNIRTVKHDTTVRDTAIQMAEGDVGMLPVMKGSKLLGVITVRDLTIRCLAQSLPPEKTAVSAIMSCDVIFCYAHEDLSQAIESFEQAQIRRLVILDRKKKLVGVLSIGDLAVDTSNRKLAGEVLERVSSPSH